MLREITWREFLELQAYSALEPAGEERADLRAGIIASAIVNALIAANSDPRKGRPRFTKPVDFMPPFGAEPTAGAGRSTGAREPVGPSAWRAFKGALVASARAR